MNDKAKFAFLTVCLLLAVVTVFAFTKGGSPHVAPVVSPPSDSGDTRRLDRVIERSDAVLSQPLVQEF